MLSQSEFSDLAVRVRRDAEEMDLDQLAADRASLAERIDQLGAYSHPSHPQREELGELMARRTLIDEVIGERHAAARSSRLEYISRAAADPSNRESGDGSGVPGGLGRRTFGRRSDGADGIYLSRAAWEGDWISGSQVQRSLDVLEAFRDDQVSREGRERLASLVADDSVEQDQAARLITAIGHPAYRSAFARAMRGGAQYWSDEERAAAGRVHELIRAAGTIGTGSMGMALPLDLSPEIRLVNGGSSNPWRDLSDVSATTSNFKRFIISQGATAGWTAEAVAATDGNVTLQGQDVTVYKATSWITASYEAIGWTQNGTDGDIAFADQVGKLCADAKDRLEVVAFTSGDGSAAPLGLLTAMTTGSDLTVGTGASLTFTSLAAVKEAVSPRFRTGQGTRVAWMCTINMLDRLLQVPSFTGSLTTLVDSSGPQPRMLGASIYENSAMATGSASGQRALIYGDFSQNLIVDRWPGFLLYENLVHGTGGAPTGQAGYLYTFRGGQGQTSTGAWRVGKL